MKLEEAKLRHTSVYSLYLFVCFHTTTNPAIGNRSRFIFYNASSEPFISVIPSVKYYVMIYTITRSLTLLKVTKNLSGFKLDSTRFEMGGLKGQDMGKEDF